MSTPTPGFKEGYIEALNHAVKIVKMTHSSASKYSENQSQDFYEGCLWVLTRLSTLFRAELKFHSENK